MAKKKEVKHYVLIVDGKPLTQLISNRTAKERSEITKYKQLAGIEVKEAQQADFERELKSKGFICSK